MRSPGRAPGRTPGRLGCEVITLNFLFQTFEHMVNADPYRLAADTFLACFAHRPTTPRNTLETVLRNMCAEKGPTFLGLNTSEIMPVEICEARSILIWQRALAASTRVRGSDHTSEELILLDYRLMRMNPIELANHFKLS
ncbi:hypothetical protein AADG42_07335 [Ammonicoccus fulvus]|uniref:Uncharacterized protein n=1 Tax=Ammonicoccus fulvus TaxID=3138240 RepID=A0ABZ3FPL4_9ACTN